MNGKEAIAQYKDWHKERYGFGPTEKLIDKFCEINDIDIERIRKQAREEVTKVEDDSIVKHSKLPWRVEKYNPCGDELDNQIRICDEEGRTISHALYCEQSNYEYIVEACNNYEALETNYQNLLAEHQEICAIAQEQKQTIEDGNALIAKLSINVGKLLNILDYYKDLLSPSDVGKVEEIKKEVKL